MTNAKVFAADTLGKVATRLTEMFLRVKNRTFNSKYVLNSLQLIIESDETLVPSSNGSALRFYEKEMRTGVRLDLEGKMTGGNGSIAFRNRIRDLLKQGKNKIALDLYDLIYIDSYGIAEIVSALDAAMQTNGKIIILHLREGKVKNRLIEANLLTAFEIAITEEEAIQHLFKL